MTKDGCAKNTVKEIVDRLLVVQEEAREARRSMGLERERMVMEHKRDAHVGYVPYTNNMASCSRIIDHRLAQISG